MSTSVLIYYFWMDEKTVEGKNAVAFIICGEMKRGVLAAFRCRLVIMTHVRDERITVAFEIHKKEKENNEKGKRM